MWLSCHSHRGFSLIKQHKGFLFGLKGYLIWWVVGEETNRDGIICAYSRILKPFGVGKPHFLDHHSVIVLEVTSSSFRTSEPQFSFPEGKKMILFFNRVRASSSQPIVDGFCIDMSTYLCGDDEFGCAYIHFFVCFFKKLLQVFFLINWYILYH